MSALALAISCHCGAAKQTVTVRLRPGTSDKRRTIDLCHCVACRHTTGLLCVSYTAIHPPESIEALEQYDDSGGAVGLRLRLFCRTCGCHIFRRRGAVTEEKEEDVWEVATGVIIGSVDIERTLGLNEEKERKSCYLRPAHVESTRDGGLSLFIRDSGIPPEGDVVVDASEPLAEKPQSLGHGGVSMRDTPLTEGGREEEVLNAHCHCGTVRFHITRPNEASRLPRSNFPDLMIPYHTANPEIQNPRDEKWWLRPAAALNSSASTVTVTEQQPGLPVLENRKFSGRYLAGTCACRSCRLTSGFEIQTWAFVPRANIFFHVNLNDDEKKDSSTIITASTTIIALDFATLPSNILTSYESTAGVRREFCGRCGATVFWRDRWRPELLDVSVGLLDAHEGARAETWLDWWTARVSFAEDAGLDRTGETARLAVRLIDGLQEGLRTWGEDGNTK